MKNLRTALLATAIMLNEQIRSRAKPTTKQWISDTISKYNRCVTAKDAAYQLIYKEVK